MVMYSNIMNMGKKQFQNASLSSFRFWCKFCKAKAMGERTWTVSIYNVYNRRNPFFIYFEDFIDNNVEYIEAKQVSLFPIIPTVRYGFKF